MARRGTLIDRRAQVLPLQPARRHTEQAKRRMRLVARTIGVSTATIKIGMANLVYNFQRHAWLEGQIAPNDTGPAQKWH